MRDAFWRRWMSRMPFMAGAVAASPAAARPAAAVPAASAVPDPSAAPAMLGDIDLRVIWQALVRKRMWVIGPTLLVLVLSLVAVNLITPRYKSEARILIEGRDNVFLRPTGERAEERGHPRRRSGDEPGCNCCCRAISPAGHQGEPARRAAEFDPVLRGVSPLRTLLALFGIGKDPFKMTPRSASSNRTTAGSPPMRSKSRA